jgi:hypothetical protein
VERGCNLEADRDSATRQCEHDHARTALIGAELGGQPSTGIETVTKASAHDS